MTDVATSPAAMPTHEQIVLTPEQAANLLGLAPATLEGWRRRGEGPKFLKLGRLVRYRRVDLESYLTSRLVQSTAHSHKEQARPKTTLFKYDSEKGMYVKSK